MRRIALTLAGAAGLLLSVVAPVAAFSSSQVAGDAGPIVLASVLSVRAEPPADPPARTIAAPSRPTKLDLSTPGATTWTPGGLRGF